MSITDEVATFIIDYAEKGTNAILLQMNNNKCHEIWLKLAPLLNIMSERSIKFMEWQRVSTTSPSGSLLNNFLFIRRYFPTGVKIYLSNISKTTH